MFASGEDLRCEHRHDGGLASGNLLVESESSYGSFAPSDPPERCRWMGAEAGNVRDGASPSEVEVPLNENGAKKLKFTTTAANQHVVITFSAACGIAGPRGKWLGSRITVDGVEANPASGYDFALCTAIKSGFVTRSAGFCQSTFVVPTPGEHEVRIYARASSGTTNWGLFGTWLVVR